MNKIDGVYQVDILGPFGWERFSTAFINDGEFRSASAEHFTAGTCLADGRQFEMEGSMTQYTDHRPLFGETRIERLPIEFRGAIENGVIDGEARVVEDDKYSIRFRLNRLTALN